MLTGYTLRLATEADLPAIARIYNSIIAGRMVTADLEPVSVESRRPWLAAHTPDKRPVWVLVDDASDTVCAWLSLDTFFPRVAYDGTALVAIYVAETHRGLGLGRALLQEAVQRAPALGIRTLLGYIFAHNKPSLRLFSAQGFSRWAHLPRLAQLDGVERDLVIVGLRLVP
ncbi:MAG TPA: GNAT family N-acetyltransferase [Opitutaceae bacterium]